jgi:hypothetical protein
MEVLQVQKPVELFLHAFLPLFILWITSNLRAKVVQFPNGFGFYKFFLVDNQKRLR